MKIPPDKQYVYNHIIDSMRKSFEDAVMQIEQSNTLINLILVTGLPKKIITDQVESNIISYEDTFHFYTAFGRFPNAAECRFIYESGINNIISIMDKKISL